jgi:predicted O-methyltransferase YrrM
MAALDEARQGLRYANVPTADGRLLRQLTEAVGAKRVVEFGTSTGESGIWFALALRKTGGHLFTHEISAERIAVARRNFQRAGVEDLITIIEGDGHETVKQHKEPIDVVFIDADKPGYPDYLKQILPLVRPGGLILAHNMHQPPPDPRYIEALTTNPELDTSFVFMDSAGIGITLKKR